MGAQSQFPGSMTARQFAAAARQAKVSPLKLARARRVLVDGGSVLEVATSEGVIVDTVYKAIHSVYSPPVGRERLWPALAPPRRG